MQLYYFFQKDFFSYGMMLGILNTHRCHWELLVSNISHTKYHEYLINFSSSYCGFEDSQFTFLSDQFRRLKTERKMPNVLRLFDQ